MAEGTSEHLDVVLIGAGISGIAVGYHLQNGCPNKSYAILEARAELGGTWDFFRYPGVRSDSDIITLGYSFKPWTGKKSIVDGGSILEYVRQAAGEHRIDEKIRYQHRVVQANWSNANLRWEIEVERTDTGDTVFLSSDFLMACSGLYSYEQGHKPTFKGVERFEGAVVHPQEWPEDLDYIGKRIVVVGSGATAVTLVPALAERAAHVTMLQRSPTYILAAPAVDSVTNGLRRILPERTAYSLSRWKNMRLGTAIFEFSRRYPKAMRWIIRKGAQRLLPAGYDVDTHFKPRYEPWAQRMCITPNGALFTAISNGSVSIATDEIVSFTERGLELASGEELEADVIITATGLKFAFGGGACLAIDGKEIDLGKRMTYKGTMLDGVPNYSFTFGYPNISWTLRVELISEHLCRLLKHMDANGYRCCMPKAPSPDVAERTLFDLTSSFVLRGAGEVPSQGSTDPWRVKRYPDDVRQLTRDPLEDGTLQFSTGPIPARPPEKLPA